MSILTMIDEVQARSWSRPMPMRILAAIMVLALAPWFISTATSDSHQLKGTMFMSVANGNTFAGRLKNGTAFKVYFLSGGIATYIDDTGKQDSGLWRVRNDDAVCVRWKTMNGAGERCAIVRMEGTTLKLEGNVRVGEVQLLGGIVEGFGK